MTDDMAQPHAKQEFGHHSERSGRLTPTKSAICIGIDLAGLPRRPHETLHRIDAGHDAAQTAWQGVFP